tara:strand:- start:2859 stop:3812 length:954 start_codon:yes stop_codon:yes gene_type:complete
MANNRGRLRNDDVDEIFEKLEGGNSPSSGANQFDMQYPLELTSAESQHFMLITCYAEGAASFETTLQKTSSRGGNIADTVSSAFGGGGAAGLGGILGGLGGSQEEIVQTTRVGKKRGLEPQESIALYHPAVHRVGAKNEYEMAETQRFAGGGMFGWLGNLVDAGLGLFEGGMNLVVGGEANRLASAGKAKNPNKEALFKETSERSYSFDFIFVPKSHDETYNVHQIVRTLRYHAHPKLLSRRYFEAPSEFEVKFFSGGKENQYIPRCRRMVMTAIDVDYGDGDAFAAYDDGAPAYIKLSISMQEVEQLHKDHIKHGF